MNTLLLFLLVSPLMVLTSQGPQNVNDLGLWLAEWEVQQVEHLNGLTNTVNEIVLDTAKNWLLVELSNGTEIQITLLQKDIEILKGRLAIAAIFSSVYMIITTLWLIGQLAVLVKKSVKKHQLKRHKEEVELMDQRLQERREKRKAAVKARSSSHQQQ